MNPRVVLIFITLVSLVGKGGTVCTAQAHSPETPTVESRETPAHPLDSALEQRRQAERRSREPRFSILPHKPSYLLPAAYCASPNNGVYAGQTDGSEKLDNLEVKFHLSIKTVTTTGSGSA